MDTPELPKNIDPWIVVKTIPNYKSDTWGIRRHHTTSGKGRARIIANGMTEYFAKTLANSANAGRTCFWCDVVAPNGDVLRNKMDKLVDKIIELEKQLILKGNV